MASQNLSPAGNVVLTNPGAYGATVGQKSVPFNAAASTKYMLPIGVGGTMAPGAVPTGPGGINPKGPNAPGGSNPSPEKGPTATPEDLTGKMASYQQQMIGAASDASRQNLANDLQTVKQNSSQRGLLYSGVNAGNQAAAKGYESGQLANKIQGINATTNAQEDQYKQLQVSEGLTKANQDTSLAAFQAQEQQTAYEQALQQQQSNNNFWNSIFGTAGKSIGTVAGIAAGAALL